MDSPSPNEVLPVGTPAVIEPKVPPAITSEGDRPAQRFIVVLPWCDVSARKAYVWTARICAASRDDVHERIDLLLSGDPAILFDLLFGWGTSRCLQGPNYFDEHGVELGEPDVISIDEDFRPAETATLSGIDIVANADPRETIEYAQRLWASLLPPSSLLPPPPHGQIKQGSGPAGSEDES